MIVIDPNQARKAAAFIEALSNLEGQFGFEITLSDSDATRLYDVRNDRWSSFGILRDKHGEPLQLAALR